MNTVMRRPVLFAVLALLLLAMQQQALVHPITHLATRTAPAPESALSTPGPAVDCVECALLAGGFNVVHGTPAASLPPAHFAALPLRGFKVRATDAPAWFHSRAPPILC
jgi:hypothetical protein